MTARAIRWSDNDRYFGPFTWSYSKSYSHWAAILKSRGDGGCCFFRLTLRRITLIVALPGIVQPWREKVYPQSWDAETVKRLGRDWYWNVIPREYGFSLNDGHLSVHYGRSSMDSRTEQRWGCFLPWTQWRMVRHSLYGLRGELIWTDSGRAWDAYFKAKEACPRVAFAFADYDGERLEATTLIEEREWRFGTGWFKWLSLFRRPKIGRSLDIRFSGETGREKGSWKGGTVGTGIDMLPGEDHESAFRRYCSEQHRSKSGNYTVTFLSRADLQSGPNP